MAFEQILTQPQELLDLQPEELAWFVLKHLVANALKFRIDAKWSGPLFLILNI
jgi:hypothetical protein